MYKLSSPKREYICSTDMDIFALTETWLTEKDVATKLEITPTEIHKVVQQDRQGRRGGGTGLLYKENMDVKKIESGERTSFEFSEWRVTYTSLRTKLIIIYRPLFSQAHPITPPVFFEEVSSYLESFSLFPELLILPGDFNFHMDVASDLDAQIFSDLLTSMGLKQHVTVPTHISGHTLDLLITREHDPVICSAPMTDRYLSDPASVLYSLNSPKPGHVVKEISYRKLKSIDFDSLCSDLKKSELCTKEFSNLCELTSSYNSTLSSLLDEHAPLKKEKTVISSREQLLREERLRENGVTLIPSRTFALSRLHVITLHIS